MTSARFICHQSQSTKIVRPVLILSFLLGACGGTLDAGWDEPRGKLPVDARNPIVICNDGFSDNWQGEYAMLLANSGGPPLAGIIVTGNGNWPDVEANLAGWQQMVDEARQGGLRNIPDPIASDGTPLVRPSSGDIEATVPNQSEGAQFILDAAGRISLPYRPLVVVTGATLTDVADAYLMDNTLPERVVVVSSLGTVTSDGGEMGVPNGELDQWADVIVARKFRYVQVSAYYDQLTDVPSSLLPQLPVNAFTSWIQSKQSDVWDNQLAADQVGVAAIALPEFISSIDRVVQDGEESSDFPMLFNDPNGPAWLVTGVSGAIATARLWQMLLDPTTFGSQ